MANLFCILPLGIAVRSHLGGSHPETSRTVTPLFRSLFGCTVGLLALQRATHRMEGVTRATLQEFTWSQARLEGAVGLLALQSATHGEWLPDVHTASRLRAACAAFRWLFTKRLREVGAWPEEQEARKAVVQFEGASG